MTQQRANRLMLGTIAMLALATSAYYVWPTPYFYYRDHRYNRLTGQESDPNAGTYGVEYDPPTYPSPTVKAERPVTKKTDKR